MSTEIIHNDLKSLFIYFIIFIFLLFFIILFIFYYFIIYLFIIYFYFLFFIIIYLQGTSQHTIEVIQSMSVFPFFKS